MIFLSYQYLINCLTICNQLFNRVNQRSNFASSFKKQHPDLPAKFLSDCFMTHNTSTVTGKNSTLINRTGVFAVLPSRRRLAVSLVVETVRAHQRDYHDQSDLCRMVQRGEEH
jgi:hypothetical protein